MAVSQNITVRSCLEVESEGAHRGTFDDIQFTVLRNPKETTMQLLVSGMDLQSKSQVEKGRDVLKSVSHSIPADNPDMLKMICRQYYRYFITGFEDWCIGTHSSFDYVFIKNSIEAGNTVVMSDNDIFTDKINDNLMTDSGILSMPDNLHEVMFQSFWRFMEIAMTISTVDTDLQENLSVSSTDAVSILDETNEAYADF